MTILELFNSQDPYIKRMILQILGLDLKLRDKKLYLEAKSQFIFLRNKQKSAFQKRKWFSLTHKWASTAT